MKISQEPKIINQIFNRLLSGDGDGKIIINIITIGSWDVTNGDGKALLSVSEDVKPEQMTFINQKSRREPRSVRYTSPEALQSALSECHGNQKAASRLLGLNYTTFRERLNKIKRIE